MQLQIWAVDVKLNSDNAVFTPIVPVGLDRRLHGSKVLPPPYLHSTHYSTDMKLFYDVILQVVYEINGTYWQGSAM